jgi:glycosyltransferase involved in cell wall biosynthesis
MKSTPRITVLMPVYNAQRFLREAIDSVLQQSFTDFEFIIIDDGSTDNSVNIISSCKDPRVRFFQNQVNLGISETLNRGIGLSSAELLARMDADDICKPLRLQKQYDYMSAHPQCALLSTWARVITEDKKFVRLERYRSDFYYYNLTFECWMYHPTIMFRKGPIQQIGMYRMPYSEDYDLFWRVSTQFQIGNIAEPLVDYRLSSTSLNTVLRKQEYDIANEQNVIRNIRYYMGNSFQLSPVFLECLRHNFGPLAATKSVSEILKCLSVLRQITEEILYTDNINLDIKSIRRAHYFKRRFIIKELARILPASKSVALLARTATLTVLFEIAGHSLQWRTKKMLRKFIQASRV